VKIVLVKWSQEEVTGTEVNPPSMERYFSRRGKRNIVPGEVIRGRALALYI